MTWTYSGDPAGNDKDEVRFLVGDTDTTDQLITDEEIAYLLTVYPDDGTQYSNYRAAAAAAKSLAAKYAREVDKTVGSLSIAFGRKAQQFRDLATALDDDASKGAGQRRMGGPQLGGGGDTYLMGDDWK